MKKRRKGVETNGDTHVLREGRLHLSLPPTKGQEARKLRTSIYIAGPIISKGRVSNFVIYR